MGRKMFVSIPVKLQPLVQHVYDDYANVILSL